MLPSHHHSHAPLSLHHPHTDNLHPTLNKMASKNILDSYQVCLAFGSNSVLPPFLLYAPVLLW